MPRVAFYLMVAGLSLPLPVMAAAQCPFPQGMQASIEASRHVVQARADGAPREQLLQGIPAKLDEPTRQLLREIVSEVYDNEPVQADVYAAYRFEHCFLSQQHAETVAAIKFSDALPLLRKCEQIEPLGARPPCAMRAVHAVTGIPE